MSQLDKQQLMECTNCACFNLRKASRAITQIYDEALRETGLRVTQFSLLVAATLIGKVTVTRLADIGVMDRTTLTRNLQPLEREGHIKITPGDDGRTRIVQVTAEGEAILSQAIPLWSKAQAEVIEILGKDRWTSIQADLSEMASLAQRS